MAKEISKHKKIKGYSKAELDAAVRDAKRYRLGLEAVLQWADHAAVVRRHAEAALAAKE